MRTKKCKQCGAIFNADRKWKYLCEDCAKKSKTESVLRERQCIDCGATFVGYPKSKRCPTCQQEANRARDRVYHQKGSKRKLGSIDHCEKCGAEYVVCSGRQRYCPNCSKSAVNENIKAHKREYMAEHAEEMKPQKDENRSYNKVCVVCGKVFDNGLPTVTCSPECAKIRKAQLQAESDKRRAPRKRNS